MLDNTYLMHGVCRECTASISGSVSVCDDHETSRGQPCAACGTPFAVWAEQRCDVCGFAKRLPVELFVMGLTPVIGFLDNHGMDILTPSFDELVDLLQTRFNTSVTEEPFRAAVTIEGATESLTVTLDDSVNVVETDRQPCAE